MPRNFPCAARRGAAAADPPGWGRDRRGITMGGFRPPAAAKRMTGERHASCRRRLSLVSRQTLAAVLQRLPDDPRWPGHGERACLRGPLPAARGSQEDAEAELRGGLGHQGFCDETSPLVDGPPSHLWITQARLSLIEAEKSTHGTRQSRLGCRAASPSGATISSQEARSRAAFSTPPCRPCSMGMRSAAREVRANGIAGPSLRRR